MYMHEPAQQSAVYFSVSLWRDYNNKNNSKILFNVFEKYDYFWYFYNYYEEQLEIFAESRPK